VHHKAKGTSSSNRAKRSSKSVTEELRQVNEKLAQAEGIIAILAEAADAETSGTETE
jgi:hypothetical protein